MRAVVKSHVVYPALRLLGVIGEEETPTAQEAQDAVDALNLVLDSWGATRLYPFSRATRLLTTVPGQAAYLIGPDAPDLVVPWPARVDFAAWREAGGDSQLRRLTFEQYEVMQAAAGTPEAFWYDPTVPAGTLSLWPTPGVAGVVALAVTEGLPTLELDSEVELPPGYADALKYALAVKIANEFGRDPPAAVVGMADQALRTIRRARLPVGLSVGVPVSPFSGIGQRQGW